MPTPANVVPVLVASPGDLRAERDALRQLMWDFNDEHAVSLKVVLLPILWETHARPQVGAHPQDAIVRQLVQTVDLVIALFWTRIGSLLPDGKAATVHEIEEHVASGKPALIYFSNSPVQPGSFDPK